ncbi:MAG: hypothetical protein M1500_03470 [Candidatus Marsarchaeota archaeon]|nr:hypothetical protein [Candidatus Marsarchaeota archaeon]MCL5112740.1 hypothetical protein [Candidatus Marsarchaeota archaeon]
MEMEKVGRNETKKQYQLVITNQGKRFYKMYLAGARNEVNLDELAGRIMRLSSVAEVFITTATTDDAILLKTRFKEGMEPQNVVTYIGNRIGTKFGRIADMSMTTNYRARR